MLDSLNELILETIFLYLDKKDLMNLMTINTELFSTGERVFWRSAVLVKRRDYVSLKLKIQRVSRFVRKLAIPAGSRFQNIEFLSKVSRSLRGLSEIDLRDMQLPKNYFRVITLRCPALKIINLSRTDVTDYCLILISQNCKNIKKLELLECNSCTDFGIRHFENTSLSHLTVSSQKITSNICLSFPRHLTHLHVERLGQVKPYHLLNMPSTLKQVKFISTTICDVGIHNILILCTAVEQLSIIRGYEWQITGFYRKKSLSQEQIEHYLLTVPTLQCIQQE